MIAAGIIAGEVDAFLDGWDARVQDDDVLLLSARQAWTFGPWSDWRVDLVGQDWDDRLEGR